MRSHLPRGLLRPDVPARPSFTVAEVPCRAKLDQNESPVDLPPEVKEEILAELRDGAWNRYPQPLQYAEVKARFAEAVGQRPERVVITVGCDQMILLCYWAAGGPGRRARVFEPTYPMFGHYARITQTELDSVVLGPDLDMDARCLTDPVELLMLVSPNNPTGGGPDRELVLQALAPGRGLVFVDEAYADYAGQSVVDLVAQHPSLLVGRSLSKALLAGVRLGYGVGHPEVVAALERLLFAPYHLCSLQLAVARRYDRIRPLLARRVEQVTAERERLCLRLRGLGLKVWPSRANFILFAVADAGRTYNNLLGQGVRLRNVSSMPGLESHLRVTVGTAEENDLFLQALEQAV